jgi:hypothetical protein
MNSTFARSLRIASFAALAFAPQGAGAQSSSPVTITLMVPVQVKDLDAKVTKIRVHCTAQPVGAAIKVTFDRDHDYADAGPVTNGSLNGSAEVELKGTSPQRLAPGQQWSYKCRSEFVTATAGTKGGETAITPGSTGAALAATSAPNLIEGTFTTQ